MSATEHVSASDVPIEASEKTTPSARFRCQDDLLDGSNHTLVRLEYSKDTADQSAALYAHREILSVWSGVLRNALDLGCATGTSNSTGSALEASEAKQSCLRIPIGAEEVPAWEDALALMYPSVPLFSTSWESAGRLALLADKYDMPCIMEHVRLFIGQGQLEQHLLAARHEVGRTAEWLSISSKCGLEEQVDVCIKVLVEQQLLLPLETFSGIRQQHGHKLLEAKHKALQQQRQQRQELQQQLAAETAAHRKEVLTQLQRHGLTVSDLQNKLDAAVAREGVQRREVADAAAGEEQQRRENSQLRASVKQLRASLSHYTSGQRATCFSCGCSFLNMPDGKRAKFCFHCGEGTR